MEKLPTDVITDILSMLPYEAMINCKLVCKPWRRIISSIIKVGLLFKFGWNPDSKLCFGGEEYNHIDTHEIYSYKALVELDIPRCIELEPPLSDMIGSCNGLVCFLALCKSAFGHYFDPIYICNPITEEYVYLPTFNFVKPVDGYFSPGFGYHHSTNEYKVVRIFRELFTSCSHVQVYTLGSGHGWRDLGRVDLRVSVEAGVCAYGTLHWFEKHKKQIVAFDLAEEKFELISLPKLLQTIPYFDGLDTFLTLLGGYLSVVHMDDVGKEDRFIHILALEKKKKFSSCDIEKQHEFKYVWSWRKTFSIPCSNDVRYTPFAVTKSNQVLMSHNTSVFCYDSENTTLRKLWDDSPRVIGQAIPYVQSHVSLEALGEKSKRRR